MDMLYDIYFDEKKRGKMYRTEAEYMEDMYAFVDMCIAGLCLLLVKSDEESEESEKAERVHIREIPQSMEQAYDALMRRQNEPDEDKKAYIKEQLINAREHVRERLLFTPFNDKKFKMRLLCKRLSLTDMEQFFLFLGYAGSYDEKYSSIFSDVQSAGTTQPTFRLTVFLYSLYADVDIEEAGRLLEQKSTLFESFFDIKKDTSGKPESFGFACNRRICGFLRGYCDLDKDIKRAAVYHSENESLPEFIIREEQAKKTEGILRFFLQEQHDKGNALHLYGPDGNGKKLFLQHAAKRCGYGVIFVDVVKLEKASFEEMEIAVSRLIQESILLHAVLCFIDKKGREELEGEEQKYDMQFPQILAYLLELLAQKVTFFAWISPEKSQYLLNYPLHLLCMEQPMLSVGERIVLWEAFTKRYPVSEQVDKVICANKYILSVKGIQEVLRTADFVRIQDEAAKIEQEHIRMAMKQQSPNQLGRFATLIEAVYTWDDLIVDKEQIHQMHLICNQLKYRNVVGEEWGFFKKTAYGRGVCALFYGSPGTGKTMAVQVMANELGLDLYRVDLSQMVSKYIGETEKNISTLFKKAQNINAILFFDEADSLFAKRSEVKDSHDRNANAETAHLLQKLEDYDGITILATNYVNNIDDAFKRRIKFMVNFSFPTPDVRLKLWNTILPKKVPLEEELDFEYYAEHFELSGSSIKEILINAAFIAAAGNEQLANRHIIEAVKLNFAKYGKMLSDSDFGYLI